MQCVPSAIQNRAGFLAVPHQHGGDNGDREHQRGQDQKPLPACGTLPDIALKSVQHPYSPNQPLIEAMVMARTSGIAATIRRWAIR